jgi:hypothetical protein
MSKQRLGALFVPPWCNEIGVPGVHLKRRCPIFVIAAKAAIQILKIPGFRVALAIASLPGMTAELFNGFRNTILDGTYYLAKAVKSS